METEEKKSAGAKQRIIVLLGMDDIEEAQNLIREIKGLVGGFIIGRKLIKRFFGLFTNPADRLDFSDRGRKMGDFFAELSNGSLLLFEGVDENLHPGKAIKVWPSWALLEKNKITPVQAIEIGAEIVLVDSSVFNLSVNGKPVEVIKKIASEIEQTFKPHKKISEK